MNGKKQEQRTGHTHQLGVNNLVCRPRHWRCISIPPSPVKINLENDFQLKSGEKGGKVIFQGQ